MGFVAAVKAIVATTNELINGVPDRSMPVAAAIRSTILNDCISAAIAMADVVVDF